MSDSILSKQAEPEFEKRYRLQRWWVTRRASVRRLLLTVFFVADALIFAYAIWIFSDTFFIGGPQERAAVERVIESGQSALRGYSQTRSAQKLEVGDTVVLSLGGKKYDFAAMIANPNADWVARFEYRFVARGYEGAWQAGFAFPGDEKPLLDLAIELDARPAEAEVELRSVAWQRLDPHDIADPATWKQEHIGFVVSDAGFVAEPAVSGTSVGRATFTVKNTTAFSYWEPAFLVLLYRGQSIAGVSRIVLTEFESGETQDVSVAWFGALPSVSRVEVIPEIDLLDEDVYMTP